MVSVSFKPHDFIHTDDIFLIDVYLCIFVLCIFSEYVSSQNLIILFFPRVYGKHIKYKTTITENLVQN